MKNFLNSLKYKIQVLMQGRYGYDELSRALVIISLLFFVLSAVFKIHLLYMLAGVLLLWSYFRCFSRNFQARQKEFSVYYRIKNKMQKKIRLYKNMWKERKTHRYFKCNKCGAMLKVPKGKGKIQITCKVCQNKMTRKS